MERKNKIVFSIFFTIFIVVLLTGVVKAYFSDLESASGQVQVSLELPETTLEKREENNIKYFKVNNTGNSECFVRVKVFGIGLEDSMINIDSSWEKKGDGYIYYKNPLNIGESTTEISINKNSTIICIGEYCNVSYDENENAICDWNYSVGM